MSYDEYRSEAIDAANKRDSPDDERDTAAAQVWATLALAEAIREGFGALTAAVESTFKSRWAPGPGIRR